MGNNLMLNIPFARQINNCTCGAACLQMIFSYYGISCDQRDIFNAIQTPDQSGNAPYCDLAKMVLRSNNLGLACAGVVPKEPASFLKFCLKSDISVILLFHRDKNSLLGHFGVLTGAEKNLVYIHDPFIDNGANSAYLISEFISQHMKRKESSNRNDDIGLSYSMLLFTPPALSSECASVTCRDCGASFPIMAKVAQKVDQILCPYEDAWKPIG